MPKQNYQYEEKDDMFRVPHEYKKKYRNKDPTIVPEANFSGHDVIARNQRHHTQFGTDRPPVFINRPLSRADLRKKFMRTITKKEIDWRNLPMMTKFMNDSGKIYNRYQTRLKTPVQRRVAHTIKRMRDMELLPHVGQIKPTDKIPVGSFMEDVEEMHRKSVDPVTGRLFMKQTLQTDLRARQQTVKEKFD